MRKHLFSLFALVLCLGLLPVGTLAVEEPAVSTEEEQIVAPAETENNGESIETITVTLPDQSFSYEAVTTAPSVNLFSTNTEEKAIMNIGSTAADWIDRLNISKTDSDPVWKFYNMLLEAATYNNKEDYLIDDDYLAKNEYKILILDETGTLETTKNDGSASAELQKKVDAYYDAFAAVYAAVTRDHPEIFWINRAPNFDVSDTTTASGSSTDNVTFKWTYKIELYWVLKDASYDIRLSDYRSESLITEAISNKETYIATINEELSSGASVYEKISYYNNWLTKHNCYCTATSYADYTRNPMTALKGNSGVNGPVCEGYARAFKILCDTATPKIPCTLVDGTATSSPDKNGEAHMWCYVQVDGDWYAVDVTWNDPSIKKQDGSYITDAVSGYEKEDYLLLGKDTIVDKNHPEFTFIDSHPVENSPLVFSDGTKLTFPAGPELSADAYVPPVGLFASSLSSGGVRITCGIAKANIPDDTKHIYYAAYGEGGKMLGVDCKEADNSADFSDTFDISGIQVDTVKDIKAFFLDENYKPTDKALDQTYGTTS